MLCKLSAASVVSPALSEVLQEKAQLRMEFRCSLAELYLFLCNLINLSFSGVQMLLPTQKFYFVFIRDSFIKSCAVHTPSPPPLLASLGANLETKEYAPSEHVRDHSHHDNKIAFIQHYNTINKTVLLERGWCLHREDFASMTGVGGKGGVARRRIEDRLLFTVSKTTLSTILGNYSAFIPRGPCH